MDTKLDGIKKIDSMDKIDKKLDIMNTTLDKIENKTKIGKIEKMNKIESLEKLTKLDKINDLNWTKKGQN